MTKSWKTKNFQEDWILEKYQDRLNILTTGRNVDIKTTTVALKGETKLLAESWTTQSSSKIIITIGGYDRVTLFQLWCLIYYGNTTEIVPYGTSTQP